MSAKDRETGLSLNTQGQQFKATDKRAEDENAGKVECVETSGWMDGWIDKRSFMVRPGGACFLIIT